MRTWILSIAVVVLGVGIARPQAQAPAEPGRVEGSLSVHGLRREDASKTWPGGGFGFAWNGQRMALAGEGTITRRDGHNDWHALAGPRFALVTTGRARVFLQLMAGAVIRQKEARLSAQLGGGLDVTLNPRTWVRVQLAGLLDQTEGDSVTGGRISIGVVVR
jgi:hypothetical protein